MNVQNIRDIAKHHGVKVAKLKKSDLIRSIQRAEGNFDCFGTAASGVCDQIGCVWRTDCFKQAAQSFKS